MVRPGLQETAWLIVSGLHESLIENSSTSSQKPIEISEAVRLAGLNYVLSSRQLDEQYSFSNLSFEAEKAGISRTSITNLSNEVLESFRYSIPMNLSPLETVALLGMVHSIGCYSLPLSYKKGTFQKRLGAFYTPPKIADYIVSLTLSPKLNRLSEMAKTRGLTALEEIMSLRTLDPACGTGIFLISALKAFSRAMKSGIENAQKGGVSYRVLKTNGILDYKQITRHNLYGVDIDSGALEVTDVSLRLLSQTDSRKLGESELFATLKQGNSLISLKGINGDADYNEFFRDPVSRSPFEWNDEFGDILKNGGFDFIIMNPPYERLKPNLAEFLRERLLTRECEIYLQNFSKYKERMIEDIRYFRKSGEYNLGNRYTIDVYRLFIERALQLTGKGSYIGFVVPSSILGDLSAFPIRKSILQENRLLTVDDFPETSRMFEGVTQSVTIITLKRGGKTKSFLAKFGLNDIEDASSCYQNQIPADKIEKIGSSSLAIPQVNKVGWKLMSKLHIHPSIHSFDYLSVNRGELDLTLNRDCITSSVTDFRLIRGSSISRYLLSNRVRTRTEYVDIEKLKSQLGTSVRVRHINQFRIAGQQVSNRTQRWRLKFADIPPNFVLANSCNYLAIQGGSDESYRLSLLGILNSELMNWRFSLTNTNNHISIRELTQLPVPDMKSSESQGFREMLIEEVRKFKSNDTSPKIEALVFALYGFSVKESRAVLKLRSTPGREIDAILSELESITS
ncbi:MAG: Eco57I restriction-modification methylase domain-containing protein [Candidatus Thorarchaeota archaeon SMTZ1-45]|nr:MAG: hypothetical protein AM325_11610 [Candidatus Thorarchaeota archaeon SMTZ1-45]